MSRIAKSSPDMWESIFRQNRENILESIDIFSSEIEKFRKMIEKKDWNSLYLWMLEANKLHGILS